MGNSTLGEEYCDIVQVEEGTRRLPSIYRRSGYILAAILLPYGLNRILPAFRRRLKAKLEAVLRKKTAKKDTPTTGLDKFQSYILANIDTITSPSPVYAVGLAVFYFSGAYYHLSKRMCGLRYIFTRNVEASSQRVGYEVLGVLLVLQLSLQAWMHMHNTYTHGPLAIANVGSVAGGTGVVGHGVAVSLREKPECPLCRQNVLVQHILPLRG